MPLRRNAIVIKDDADNNNIGHVDAPRIARDVDLKRRKARTLAKQQQAAERIATASTQLMEGLNEAGSAIAELRTSMEQIASGAEEASSAAQEGLTAMNQVNRRLQDQEKLAGLSREKTTSLQDLVGGVSTEIQMMVENVSNAAKRQTASVAVVAQLEERAVKVDEAVRSVIRIADQTSLLALNAAIEAARAGQHGKGFAVVADAVRTLAENSETNAGSIQQRIKLIQGSVQSVAEGIKQSAAVATSEVEKGNQVLKQLVDIRDAMATIAGGADDISAASVDMRDAAMDALKGSESIAAASEEQSAACEEALSSLDEQEKAIGGCSQAAEALDALADELKTSTDIAKSAEEVAGMGEELSASIEEMSKSSNQIMQAIEQISQGANQQAGASEQSAARLERLKTGVSLSNSRATEALENGQTMLAALQSNKKNVDEMISGITSALENGRSSLDTMQQMENLSLEIDKVVDGIANVAIQTSMLAVTGAVEAARAGEFGKGFAVVSTDIENLANEAMENAEQIKDMVKAIQVQIATVRNDLMQISDVTRLEVDKAKSTTRSLTTIEADATEVMESNRQIQAAAAEIATACEQAREGTEQIAAAAEQARKATNEAEIAAKQQAKGAEDLSAAIEEIASIADEIQSN